MSRSRDLTPAEQKAINLVKLHEEATDAHRLVINLEGSKEAAEAVVKLQEAGICKCIRVEYIPGTERYRIVYGLMEFEKYMLYFLKLQGLTLLMDGSVTTMDGLYVANDYLTPQVKNER